MQNWEYYVETYGQGELAGAEMQKMLDRSGRDRWELVQVIPFGNYFTFIFKRPKQ